jgi:mannosyltransferase OCH1-like enzyme
MNISIEEFYKSHKIDENFNEVLYQEQYPETREFYQPYCKNNNIDDKHRLYFHYVNYGSCDFEKIQKKHQSILKNKNKKNQDDKIKTYNKTNNYKLLIKIPTYKRPKKLKNCIQSFIDNCANTDNINIVVSADYSDKHTSEIQEYLETNNNNVRVIFGNYNNKIKAYNADIESFDFDILIFASDDMLVCQKKYDLIISNYMVNYFPDTDGCLWFDTGDNNDITNTITVVGRKLFDKIKPIYNPEYLGYFCDDEFTQKCIKLGKIIKINETIIQHNISKHLEMHNDSTYLKSLKYANIDKAKYKIRKGVQFDIAGLSELPKNHNLPEQTVAIKRNKNWGGVWHKPEPWYDDPISVFDLYILEKKYEKVFNMGIDEFIKFSKNYFRNFRWTIPKIIHQIWLGDKNSEIDEMMQSFSKKYREKYPEWRYILWDEDRLADLPMHNKEIFDKEQSYDCKSDIARLEILHQFGGIYVDSDMIWLENKPIDSLFSLSDHGILLFNEKSGIELGSGYLQKNTTRCANTTIASTIMNPIISFLISRLKNSYLENRKFGVVVATGPDFIQKHCDLLKLSINDYSYVFPVWFCVDRDRNPDYDEFIRCKSYTPQEISSKYPRSVLFHKGWAK